MPDHGRLELGSFLFVVRVRILVGLVFRVFFVFECFLQIAHLHHDYVVAVSALGLRATDQKTRVRILGTILAQIVGNDVKTKTRCIF